MSRVTFKIPKARPRLNVTGVVIAGYVGARLWQVAALAAPVGDTSDSWMYRSPGQAWLDFHLVGLRGHALRPWPVTLLYALTPTDTSRVLAQIAFATICWSFCIYQVMRLSDRHWVSLGAGILVSAMALTAPISSWDGVILAESLSLSMVALSAGAIYSLAKRPHSGSMVTIALIALLPLLLIRPTLIPVLGIVAIIPTAALYLARRVHQAPSVARVVGAACVVIISASLALYVFMYESSSDLEWGERPPDFGPLHLRVSGPIRASFEAARLVQPHRG